MSVLARIPIVFFLCCVLIAGFLLFRTPQQPNLASLDACFQSGMPDDPCVERNVKSLLNSFTTRSLMSHVIASSTPYTVTSFCHEAAHVIGKETYARSPDVESALGMCSQACNYGCVHGVIAAAVADELGEESVSEEMVHADPAELERIGGRYCVKGLCHAVGHILYIGTQAMGPALQSCDRLNAGNSAESCYQGVFMESAGGEAVFLATTSSRSDSNYAYPCDAVAAKYQHACFQYLTNFQRQLFARDAIPESDQFTIAKRACESFSGKPRSDCFFGIGYIFLRTNERTDVQPDPRRPALCETLSRDDDQDACVVGLALKNALSDKYINGLTYCAYRSDERRRSLCFNAMFQTMQNAAFTADASRAACQATAVADECEAQYTRYLTVAPNLPQYYKEGLF